MATDFIKNRTKMFSVDRDGRVIEHYFPFDPALKINQNRLKGYFARGFTFEDPRIVKEAVQGLERLLDSSPDEPVEIDAALICDVCGKECKSPLGLGSHKRSHPEVG